MTNVSLVGLPYILDLNLKKDLEKKAYSVKPSPINIKLKSKQIMKNKHTNTRKVSPGPVAQKVLMLDKKSQSYNNSSFLSVLKQNKRKNSISIDNKSLTKASSKLSNQHSKNSVDEKPPKLAETMSSRLEKTIVNDIKLSMNSFQNTINLIK